MTITIAFLIFVVLIIIIVASISISGKRDLTRDCKHIEELIQAGNFPSFSPQAQAKFIIGKDGGHILKTLNVNILEGKYLKHILTISRTELLTILSTKEFLDLLRLKDELDGLWIIENDDKHVTVEQERGLQFDKKQFKTQIEMLEAIIDYYGYSIMVPGLKKKE